MTLHLLNYNNYYNRIIKKHDTITDYAPYTLEIIENINFNPNDGVSTEQIINYVGDMPNYLVVTDANDIISRWFVIESKRTRAQQFHMILYRDTIADFEEYILDAPIFIEKATLNVASPLIFNTENITFNQIKQQEILLKDESNCPWIVGYYAKNTPEANLKGTVDANDLTNAYDVSINSAFRDWEFNATTSPFYGEVHSLDYHIYGNNVLTSTMANILYGYLRFNKNGELTGTIYVPTSETTPLDFKGKGYQIGKELETPMQNMKSTLYQGAVTYITDYHTDGEVNEFLAYDNRVIRDNEGKYYRLSIVPAGTNDETYEIKAGSLFNNLANIVRANSSIVGTPDGTSFEIHVKRTVYNMKAEELFGLETNWDMSGEKFTTEDAPYNIFAIPYGYTQIEYGEYAQATSTPSISMAVANSIIKTMADNLYDIQLLPYCPLSTPMVTTPSGVGILQIYDTEAFSLVKAPGGESLSYHIGYILNIPYANFSKNITCSIPAPITAIDKKISNECDYYRLCSPNYNGAFDFSVAKNNGVDYFNVDCCYKPFQPYIHVNPNFKGLYGSDFNDARGLICGGDFSLAQIKDAWQSYQIQNKNYNEIFARQIEHMEVSHKMQRASDIVGAVIGTVGGVAAGGAAGSMLPFTNGAVGATVGGVASAGAGIADIIVNEKLRREALDFTKDQFGYQLDNIKALPYSLTKVSSFNENNKYFPFIEYYTCTDVEKEAFRNKLLYNGMSVGVIGTIRDYLQTEPSYIKGKLIRLETLADDFHLVEVISNELNQGVFI